MAERFIASFGRADAESIMAADNEAAPTAIRLNLARATREEILEYDPPHRLSYTFSIPADDFGGRSSQVDVLFDISGQGSAVQLTVSHEGFQHDAALFLENTG